MRKIFSILLVFASFLSTYAQSHWEAIILANETWSYLPATSEPASDWNTSGFDDSGWATGPGGIGYSDDDDATVIDPCNSLYLRKDFQIIDVNSIEDILIDIDYDDAFVAYINGTEFARSANVTEPNPVYNSQISFGHEAVMQSGGKPTRFKFDKSVLQNGTNVLAVHIINEDIGSSDLSSIIYINALLNSAGTTYSNTADYFVAPLSFNSSNLPLLIIDTYGREIENEPKIDAHMGIIDNASGENFLGDPFTGYDGRIGIELRGSSSQMYDKKNMGFETRDALGENLDTNLLGMPKENDWVLHGPYADKSLMRNALTFHLGSSMGQWAPRTRFCELYINDDYRGVYVLMEKIKRDKNRLNISKLKPTEISGDDLTGGYILKVDRPDDHWISPYLGTNGIDDIIINYVYPDYTEMPVEQRTYIKDYVTDFEDALNASNYDDLTNGYRRFVNVQSFVDYFIINELSKNVDAYRLSAYFYKDKDSKGGKLSMGPLWDYNFSLGNADYYEGWNTEGWMYESVQDNDNYQVPTWWRILMSDKYFKSDLKKRWQKLRTNVLDQEYIDTFIDSIATLLNSAQQRNFEAFPVMGQYVWPNFYVADSYQSEITFMKDWISDRLLWMDNQIDSYTEYETGVVFTAKDEVNISNTSIEVYPNPFSDHLRISTDINNQSTVSISVINMLGQKVLTKQWQNLSGYNELSISNSELNIENGLYFYSIQIDNKIVKSGKLLKQ